MLPSSIAAVDSSPAPPGPSPTRIALSPIERGWPHRTYLILSEVLGPDFHGPSSSHTAAPQLIALHAQRALGGIPDFARVTLTNSFATTGEGHRTNIAVIAGLLGIATTDPRTPLALDVAREKGLSVIFDKKLDATEHPNTLVLDLRRGLTTLHVKAISIGGGNFDIVDEKQSLTQAA